MATAATVPMLAPDGTPGDIPQARVQDAVKAGFKQAVSMTSPDGKQGYIPVERQQDAVKAGFKSVGAPGTPEPPQEGFLHSLGASFGITPEAVQQFSAHPVQKLIELAGPGGSPAKALYEQGKQSFNSARQAIADYRGGNKAQAAVDAIQAVPIIGPGLVKATDQYAAGNTAGEMGTLVGTAAQAAPLVLGAADKAGIPRPNSSLPNLVGKFPTRSSAGQIFNKLNTDLAQQPVQLEKSAAPLQRAVEIGARGGTLPGPVAALLQRAQALEPMTFPEARDYQASLSDLSASDKMAMNGRMRGAVAQLNQALYQDVRQAAEAGGGYGSDFDKAMTQYRQASQINNAAKVVGKYAGKAALTTAGGATGYAILKELQK